MTTMTVRIDENTKRGLKMLAAARGMTLGKLLAQFLDAITGNADDPAAKILGRLVTKREEKLLRRYTKADVKAFFEEDEKCDQEDLAWARKQLGR